MRLSIPHPPSAVRIVDGDTQAALTEVVERLLREENQRGVEMGLINAHENAARALESAGQRFDELTAEAREQVAETALPLALEIARHLVRGEVESGRYDLETIIREALEESGTGRRNCTVHLNPKDVSRLENTSFRAGTVLEADVSVSVGNIHITTPDGLLVRDLDRAIDSIGERIMGELR